MLMHQSPSFSVRWITNVFMVMEIKLLVVFAVVVEFMIVLCMILNKRTQNGGTSNLKKLRGG